jgi:single-strand DNA-binding protein
VAFVFFVDKALKQTATVLTGVNMLNKVTLIGNLGADPEVRYMPTGGAVTTVSIATTRRWKDRQSGERRDATEWHRVVFFNRLAEIAGEYLKKGSQVYVEGRLQTRKWQGQDGQDRYTTEIIAEEMQMLGSRSGGTGEFHNEASASSQTSQNNQYAKPQPQPSRPAPTYNAPSGNMPPMPPAPPTYDDFDDDIPF